MKQNSVTDRIDNYQTNKGVSGMPYKLDKKRLDS
jgi:hypothetical protein